MSSIASGGRFGAVIERLPGDTIRARCGVEERESSHIASRYMYLFVGIGDVSKRYETARSEQ